MEPGPKASTSLSLHYATFDKSIAVDHITLQPFLDTDASEEKSYSTPEIERMQTQEKAYTPIGRRYFIPSLAVALDRIE